MHVVQISDSHICLTKPARIRELEACIDAINALMPLPDAVVHTGDVAHNGDADEYAIARDLLDRLKVPYYVLAGNRDDRGHFLQAFSSKIGVAGDAAFVQYVVDRFDVRLVFADSLDPYGKLGRFCQERLDHLVELFASDGHRPTAFFVHHPPFEVGVGPEPRNFRDWREAEKLAAFLQDQLDLCGIFCGHVHRAFDTTFGTVSAHVASCLASDLRWDQPASARAGLPVCYSLRFQAGDVHVSELALAATTDK